MSTTQGVYTLIDTTSASGEPQGGGRMRVLTPQSQRLEGAQLRCAGAYRGRPRAAPRNARQLRASADGWRRAVHQGRAHPRGRPCAERRRRCNECSVAGQRPVCQCRLGLRGCRSALPGWSRALRPRSQPARFLPSGGDRQRGPRRGGLAGCSALGRRVVPMCNESANDARPAQRSRGTGSRFGAGM